MENTIDTHTPEAPLSMSHRERVSWLALGALTVTFGPYLTWMAISPPSQPLPDLTTMRLFATAAASQMLFLGIGYLWLRIKSPEEATAPADERDRAISHRSVRLAYYVLVVGMIVVGCVMPFNSGGWHLINTAVAFLVLAQAVNYGIAVWSYRQGWHA